MARPRLLRALLAVSLAFLTVLVCFGAYYLDRRFLLLLMPPSLTYFLLDAVRDARHQKVLQAALDAKKAARMRAEGEAEDAAAEAPPKGARKEGVNNKKTRRARPA
jgi:hypothetical protein